MSRPQSVPDVATRWSAMGMIERLGGDEALARQLVALFREEYPKLLAALRVSVASGEADAVRRAAHAMKGCIANFAEGGSQQTAYEIESLASRATLEQVPSLLARLEQEVEALACDMAVFEQESSCAS